jgi:hypothetical protein
VDSYLNKKGNGFRFIDFAARFWHNGGVMLATIALLAIAGSGHAPEKFLASTDRWSYSGTVSVYNSFSDAVSGRNPRTPAIAFPTRDGSLYVARNMGGEYSEFNAILTNWYATTNPDPEKKGWGNPNNKNEGFIQMYDADASNWQNQKAYWNQAKTIFTVEAKGQRASYPSAANPGDYARLWNAGSPPASGEGTKGTFLRYEYKMVADGLTATDPDKDGYWESTGNAASYSGSFKAIFQNESTRHPESNGFYVVSLTFGNSSWAVANTIAGADKFVGPVKKN